MDRRKLQLALNRGWRIALFACLRWNFSLLPRARTADQKARVTVCTIKEKAMCWIYVSLSEGFFMRSINPVRVCSKKEQLALSIHYFPIITTKATNKWVDFSGACFFINLYEWLIYVGLSWYFRLCSCEKLVQSNGWIDQILGRLNVVPLCHSGRVPHRRNQTTWFHIKLTIPTVEHRFKK